MGEIRLQWWRDALVLPPDLRTGHPVADAVRKAAQDHQLPADLLEALIDARSLLLHDPSPLTDEALRNLLWKTEGALFALGAHVVGLPASSAPACKLCCCRPGIRAGAPAAGLAPNARCGPCSLGRGSARLQPACPQRNCSRMLQMPGWRRCSAFVLPKFAAIWTWRGSSRPPCRGRRASPSFLWPWSSLICGLSSGRAVRCCARKRVLRPLPEFAGLLLPICLADCETACRVGLGGQERDMGMRVVEVWRHALAGLLLTLALGGPASAQPDDRLGGREPLPFLPRPGRHRGAPGDLGEPVARTAQEPGAVGRAPAGRAPPGGVERLHVRQDVLGRHAQPLRLP